MQLEKQPDSSSETVDLQASEATASTEKDPQSSETEASLLSVVQNVSSPKPDTPAAAEADPDPLPGSEGRETDAGSEADPFADDVTDYTKTPAWQSPEFRGMVKDRNRFKEMARDYQPDAKQYREIQRFMSVNQLTAEEVSEGLALMAQMKVGDPSAAYEALQAKLEKVALAAGKKLPAEIEKQVEEGLVDRETATQLYTERMASARETALLKSRLEQSTQGEARSQIMQMTSAVATWEAATKASDPDFDMKVELIKDRVKAHVASNGMPKSADEALKLSKDAYEAVSKVLEKARGPKPAMRPVVGGKPNGSAKPEPRNLLDVIRQASAGA
jgi:hypothetical protein